MGIIHNRITTLHLAILTLTPLHLSEKNTNTVHFDWDRRYSSFTSDRREKFLAELRAAAVAQDGPFHPAMSLSVECPSRSHTALRLSPSKQTVSSAVLSLAPSSLLPSVSVGELVETFREGFPPPGITDEPSQRKDEHSLIPAGCDVIFKKVKKKFNFTPRVFLNHIQVPQLKTLQLVKT